MVPQDSVQETAEQKLARLERYLRQWEGQAERGLEKYPRDTYPRLHAMYQSERSLIRDINYVLANEDELSIGETA